MNQALDVVSCFRLFPMGDMPEILHSLIAKGKAILWSSQEREGFKVTKRFATGSPFEFLSHLYIANFQPFTRFYSQTD